MNTKICDKRAKKFAFVDCLMTFFSQSGIVGGKSAVAL